MRSCLILFTAFFVLGACSSNEPAIDAKSADSLVMDMQFGDGPVTDTHSNDGVVVDTQAQDVQGGDNDAVASDSNALKLDFQPSQDGLTKCPGSPSCVVSAMGECVCEWTCLDANKYKVTCAPQGIDFACDCYVNDHKIKQCVTAGGPQDPCRDGQCCGFPM
ncbi:MAG: hypothetical protein V1754_02100 [Pseudomonadota bacterium]